MRSPKGSAHLEVWCTWRAWRTSISILRSRSFPVAVLGQCVCEGTRLLSYLAFSRCAWSLQVTVRRLKVSPEKRWPIAQVPVVPGWSSGRCEQERNWADTALASSLGQSARRHEMLREGGGRCLSDHHPQVSHKPSRPMSWPPRFSIFLRTSACIRWYLCGILLNECLLGSIGTSPGVGGPRVWKGGSGGEAPVLTGLWSWGAADNHAKYPLVLIVRQAGDGRGRAGERERGTWPQGVRDASMMGSSLRPLDPPLRGVVRTQMRTPSREMRRPRAGAGLCEEGRPFLF